jgi:hypothetical protein
MQPLRTFRDLPSFLSVGFGVMLVVPVCALSFAGNPLALARTPTIDNLVVLYAYWIGPLSLLGAILARSIFIVPLFLAACIAAAFHTGLADAGFVSAPWIRTGRFASLFASMVLAGVLANRDMLYPFLQGRTRSWRRAARMSANLRMKIAGSDGGKVYTALLENISATGVAVAIANPDGAAFAASHAVGSTLATVAFKAGQKINVPMEIAWIKDEAIAVRLGLRALDPAGLQGMVRLASMTVKGTPWSQRLARFWTSAAFRHLALAAWAVVTLLAFALPLAH